MERTEVFEVTDNTIERIGDFILLSALDLTEEGINAGVECNHIKIEVRVIVE